MSNVGVYILFVAALSGVLLYLLLPRRKSRKTPASSYVPDLMKALPAPKHYPYFRQIRQALSEADTEYLMQNAPSGVAKQALRERRAVARGYLKGLHEDFSDLARLGRVIAALSPEVSRKQESQRLMLSLKFQLLYGLVWLRLATGNLPIGQLEHLTGLVGRLAARMDEAMVEIGAISAGQVPGRLGA
jgi:hypothetical protein